jgi:hypothetical protein
VAKRACAKEIELAVRMYRRRLPRRWCDDSDLSLLNIRYVLWPLRLRAVDCYRSREGDLLEFDGVSVTRFKWIEDAAAGFTVADTPE